MQYLYAFLVSGVLCVIGQILIDKTKLTPARILTGYVVAGVLLSAIGIYTPLAEFAGAGATVPLSGFGHLMAQGVKKAVDEDGLLGVLKGGLTSASAGITAAMLFSLLASIISKSKEK
ncbi:MAG: stage V sporulation protein AE [Ruminococcus sp.]|nr:stage V sporulation protein AE [Ruminococcus sp.]